MQKLFISYRRGDSEDVTGRLFDRLVAQFGKTNIFKDVDSIPLGVDFRKYLSEAVSQCQVLLAVIGDQWALAKNVEGERRLEDSGDFVRIEIEAALARGVPVIPVLVGTTATIPAEANLPPSLAPLAYRNGLRVRPDPDFHRDMDRLITAVREHLEANVPSDALASLTRPTQLDVNVVAELGFRVHSALLDPNAGNVLLRTETTTGFSDGTVRPGIQVAYFLNGTHAFDAVTDDFGVARFEGGVSAALFRMGENQITARVKGSAKSADSIIVLLAESGAKLFAANDRFVRSERYDDFSTKYHEITLGVSVWLSPLNFLNPAGVQLRVTVDGYDLGNQMTGADGTLSITKKMTYEVDVYRADNERTGGPPLRVNTSVPLVVTFAGLPETIALRVNC